MPKEVSPAGSILRDSTAVLVLAWRARQSLDEVDCLKVLDPEFWSHKQYGNGEVMSGMRATCKKLLSPDKAAKAMTQLMSFLRKEVSFASQDAWEEAKHMTPVQWWLAWGAEVPELQSVALKVLSQPISVGGVERVWSIFGWIQNKLRSKMLPATAKKLDSL